MTDYPIKLGSILFTLVEPHKGHEVDYNRWYERDHFYAGCMVGPGILAGKRWVATKPYKDLRVVAADSPVQNSGSYLALYWVERSQQNEWGTWGAKEVHRLHEQDRMFPHREHIHTRMYRYRWGAFRDEHLPKALAGSAAAMCLSFTPVPIPKDAPADIPRSPDEHSRFVHLYFLDRDPAEDWDGFASLPKVVEGTGLASVHWVGPFIPTIPGTDTYTDQLW